MAMGIKYNNWFHYNIETKNCRERQRIMYNTSYRMCFELPWKNAQLYYSIFTWTRISRQITL